MESLYLELILNDLGVSLANSDLREAASTRWDAGLGACGCTLPCCLGESPCPQTAGPGPDTAA